MSPRDIREVRIVFDVSEDLSVKSADPEEGGEVVHSAEPFARRTSPAEIPLEDRSPAERPTPSVVHLFCRGPFRLRELRLGEYYKDEDTGWPAFGFRFISRHSPTGAGPDGKDLTPGTCALRDRPLRSDEPTETVVLAPDYEEFLGDVVATLPNTPENARELAEHERHRLATRIYAVAQFQQALSDLSNLLTRSDYVVELMAHREELGGESASRYITESGSYGLSAGFPRFTPIPE